MPETETDLNILIHAVQQLFGEEAVSCTNDRAYTRAMWARDKDHDEWLRVFDDAWMDELRRLLRPH